MSNRSPKPAPAKFFFNPIGVVHSPFKKREDINPLRNINRHGFSRVKAELEIFEPYAQGLKDIEGFSHLIIVFVFHKSKESKLLVKPPLETRRRGVFSTRSPHRPNPIGLTVVRLLSRRHNFLRVSGADMIEGTPILDIKPYTPREIKRALKLGWLENRRGQSHRR
ncbi:MAG: tRNA (N6-threonylcarbamoyladenosine(37)-N6)-methyltransferase TrmO [Candidatus Aminicenantales bacterium]